MALDPTIIVVDDCADIREMLRFMLERRGYLVLEAENGQAAVELAKQECPDLILMDLHMPVLDGLSATRLLRELDELCDVPIIAVSAHARERASTPPSPPDATNTLPSRLTSSGWMTC